ncbi:MAG TPA: condensation domain-containing protein, partial [Candidatus Polarisedimenticolaceae bacterium]|nr:condensation domain-containing protein [Candidatus Polarisedimenticolaceae bacterium]
MGEIVERLVRLPPAKRARLLRALEQGTEDWRAFPLSFAQQRLWFLDRWEPASATYNLPLALRLRGSLELTALEASLDEIVRRHEVLRTTFHEIDGKAIQLVHEKESCGLVRVDLRTWVESEREARLEQLLAEEAARPFDLSRGPLLRAGVVLLAEREHALWLTLHHIVADGWSIALLLEELATLYPVCSRASPLPLPEPGLQYGDFARWQREYLQGPVLERELAYWKRRLGQLPDPLSLPADHPRPAQRSSRGAARSIEVPAALASELRALGRREGVTLFMTLLAAFDALLLRVTGQTDLVVGSPVAGRTRPETERLVGFFVNTLALRVDLTGNPTFRELLRRVRQTVVEALAHQDLPFERLVEELRPERDPAHTPIFQVMFVLQNTPAPALDLPGLAVQPLEAGHVAAKFDWTLSIDEGVDGLHVVLVYDAELFAATTAERMLGGYVRLLEGMTREPGGRVDEIELLSAEERELMVVGWNATGRDYPRECGLGELFEEQVGRRGTSVAVQDGARRWTYAELGRRSGAVASWLRARGVGPEVRVGLYGERSLELVAG